MTVNWKNGIAGTPLSRIGHAIRERRHVMMSRCAQQSRGSVYVSAVSAFSAAVGGAEGVNSAFRRMTADLPKQFWVPLCPQESAP
ncbi:hypothetical protein [Saccharomonospora cyanea]|uniref:Uncharacterized protein n=1 Tax=Saccharomonospora cyanea NA-134 TaxID=882082 RepID=H5XKF7_9PSEU|nr:hypothetical protein [Saccharomonospora cyanea]EHR59790.1 hypothetical protein SaccyDRAFT_0871 [Saccharomonospora cyanea NA-134]